MVTEFYNQETDYESFLAAAPSFVCNNLSMGMESHKVHHSDARARMPPTVSEATETGVGSRT